MFIRGETMRFLVFKKRHVYICAAVIALLIICGIVLWIK